MDIVYRVTPRVVQDDESGVVVCSRGALLALSPVCIVVARRTFYRNMLPELPVVACPHCHNVRTLISPYKLVRS